MTSSPPPGSSASTRTSGPATARSTPRGPRTARTSPEPCWPRRASHWTEPLDCAVGRSESPGAVGEAVVSSMARPPERAVPARPVRTCRTGPPVHRRGTQPFPDRSARPNRRTTRENSLAEFIYTMYKARKAVGEKLILDDVTMSFSSEEHTSELQSRGHLVCRPLLEEKNPRPTTANS